MPVNQSKKLSASGPDLWLTDCNLLYIGDYVTLVKKHSNTSQ